MTFKEAQRQYEQWAMRNRRYRTYRSQSYHLDNIGTFIGPTRDVANIFRADVQQYFNWRGKKVSKTTLDGERSTGVRLYSWLIENEIVEPLHNPFKRIKPIAPHSHH